MNLSTILWIPDARRSIYSHLSFLDLWALQKAYNLSRICCTIQIPDIDRQILTFQEVSNDTLYLYRLTQLTAFQNILWALIAKANPISDPFTLRAIRLVIQAGSDVDRSDNLHYTPLMLACSHRLPEVVQILLEAGAKTDIQNFRNETALDLIFNYGLLNSIKKQDEIEIIKLFLSNPDFISTFSQNNLCLQEIMIKSCSRGYSEIIQLLIDQGISVNFRSDTGLTPLMYAIPNHQTVRILLEAGANPDIPDNHNHLAIDYTHWPPSGNRKEVGSYLLLKSVDTRYHPYIKWLVGWF